MKVAILLFSMTLETALASPGDQLRSGSNTLRHGDEKIFWLSPLRPHGYGAEFRLNEVKQKAANVVNAWREMNVHWEAGAR